MPQKEIKKNQSQNKQQGMQQGLQMGQNLQLWQMPPTEIDLKTPQKNLEKEIETIEKELRKISDEELKKEKQIEDQQIVLEALREKYLASRERFIQNPESMEAQDTFGAFKKVYEEETKEVGALIRHLFNVKHEKFIQLRNHKTKILLLHGEKITDEWSDETAAEGLRNIINDLQKYTAEPWSACVDNIQDTMEKLQHAHQSYLDRIEMTGTAKRMAEDAEDYSHKDQILEWTGMNIPPKEVLNDYLENVNKLWGDENTRKIYLSPEHITHHIRESFFLIDYYLFFQSRRKDIEIPEEQQAAVEKADCIMNYYHEHVKNILSDYGMDMSKMKYDRKKLEAATNDEGVKGQAAYWNKDFRTYQELTGESEWEILDPGKQDFAEDEILRLEYQFGIRHENVATEAEIQRDEQVENVVERQDGYYRYRTDILSSMADHKNAVGKKKRMLQICQAMIEKLQNQGLWKENSAFNGVHEYLDRDYQNFAAINEGSYTEYSFIESRTRERLMHEMQRTLKCATSSLEKHYAAELYNLLKKEQDGDLIVPDNPKSVVYRSDKFLKEPDTLEDNVRFVMKSVKDQPLFPHEPCLKDIAQGHIGDCYFIATMVSLAVRAPGKIKEIMKDNGDGTVTVRFYDRSAKKYLYVKVDKTIPKVQNEKGQQRDFGAQAALWTKLLEKAYASVRHPRKKSLTNRSSKWSYENATKGSCYKAFKDLTGMEAKYISFEEKKISIFKGRLEEEHVNIFGKYKMETPSLVYYEATHKGDMEAFNYLRGRGVSRHKKAELKAEMKRNNKIQDLLEQLLLEEEHEKEIDIMDRKAYSDLLAKSYNKLKEYANIADKVGVEGHSLKAADLAQSTIPESMRKLLAECWNLCGKKKEVLKNIAGDMVIHFIQKLNASGKNMEEYTETEKEFLNQIENILDGGGFCELGTYKLKLKNQEIEGPSGEGYLHGMYGTHAYSVLRTEEHEIGNKKKKFLRVVNPHAKTIPLYQLGEDRRLTRVGFNPKNGEDAAIKYENRTHGVFLLELRDAKMFFESIAGSK